MEITFIVYAVSWLILLIYYICSKIRKNYVIGYYEPWVYLLFYSIYIVAAPLFVLALPYIIIKNIVERNKRREEYKKEHAHKIQMYEVRKNREKIMSQTYTLTFDDIPFTPEQDQVIYVEKLYDEKVNSYIKVNYEELVVGFRKHNLEFVYLPSYFNSAEQKERLRYYVPYLAAYIPGQTATSGYMLDYMVPPENRAQIAPSLLFCPKQKNNEWVFRAIAIDDMIKCNALVSDIVQNVENVISILIACGTSVVAEECEESSEVTEPANYRALGKDDSSSSVASEADDYGEIRFRISRKNTSANSDSSGVRLRKIIPGSKSNKDRTAKEDEYNNESPASSLEYDDNEATLLTFEEEILAAVRVGDESFLEIRKNFLNLQTIVDNLRLKGVALGAIHRFIDKQEPVSPLVITEDLRIFLPLYNKIEIELSAQMKALYFLFLNHPEGIILQHLDDYHSELMNYYRQTNNGVLTPKMEESMKNLEAYGNNQLHVIITRIRGAFCSKFDERLARNYFISGKKGEPYRIPLDPQLVEWVE